MRYIIQQGDKQLMEQSILSYKLRCYITDNENRIIDEIKGVISGGGINIDSESDIRRTFSLTIKPEPAKRNIEETIYQWLNYNVKAEIGILNQRTNEYIWFPQGYFFMTESGTTYSAKDNTLTLSLGDWLSKLNGVRNGQIGGAPTIVIPNIYTLKNAMTGTVSQQTDIKNLLIDDLGEFFGLPENNPDWEEYREDNPNWNKIPYDLEFGVGTYISEMIFEIRDLYPNCQAFFDVYNNFVFSMIPSGDSESCTLDNEFIQKMLLSDSTESVEYSISDIKNVTEVFGKSYDISRLSPEPAIMVGTTYKISLEYYPEYVDKDIIVFTPTADNLEGADLYIQGSQALKTIPIYYDKSRALISPGEITKNNPACVRINVTSEDTYASYLGIYQPHAICVLTNDIKDSFYTEEYFKQKYNCANVLFREEYDSPLAVQKLGEILDVKTGGEFDNITSNSLAIENARYYNQKATTLSDTVTITTKCIPFLDVNTKISYRKQQDSEEHEYIIKNISHNCSNGLFTSSNITLYRYYPLYGIAEQKVTPFLYDIALSSDSRGEPHNIYGVSRNPKDGSLEIILTTLTNLGYWSRRFPDKNYKAGLGNNTNQEKDEFINYMEITIPREEISEDSTSDSTNDAIQTIDEEVIIGEVEDAAIEYEGRWEKYLDKDIFVSKALPELYYVKDKTLFAVEKMLVSMEVTNTLANNVTAVSAIRGWNYKNKYETAEDMGMIVSYIKEDGKCYYRQRIDADWQYETEITFPNSLPLKSIKVSRFNDFRLAFTTCDTGGNTWTKYTRRYYQASTVQPEFVHAVGTHKAEVRHYPFTDSWFETAIPNEEPPVAGDVITICTPNITPVRITDKSELSITGTYGKFAISDIEEDVFGRFLITSTTYYGNNKPVLSWKEGTLEAYDIDEGLWYTCQAGSVEISYEYTPEKSYEFEHISVVATAISVVNDVVYGDTEQVQGYINATGSAQSIINDVTYGDTEQIQGYINATATAMAIVTTVGEIEV